MAKTRKKGSGTDKPLKKSNSSMNPALYGKEGLQEIQSGWIDGISKYYTDRGGDICTKAVKSITCPTLVVHGQKDPLVPQFHPEYLHNNIPGSKLHIMPQGKHNLHLRFADEFNLLVELL
ncbi:valacyclovir hydrolase-like [Montipora capricornis]|uniref:valacyclovir hydrolase-like n=1 Tax=Montipora capricornis TaxID=246305 RepID=UPI0035F1D4D2